MESALAFVPLFGLLVMGISFSLVVLVFCAYFRIKGIERALWAIVWEMKHGAASRAVTEMPSKPDSPGESLPPSAHVFGSMFGR